MTSRTLAQLWALVLVMAVAYMSPLLASPWLSRLAMNETVAATKVNHIAPYTCGVTSSKFARICRPAAQTSCKSAATRGVKGFSNQLCAARNTACVSCLAVLRACIGRIGHAPRAEFSCDECTGKFSRCIGKRYPTVAR
jgi:hypothetical protein